MNPIHVFLVEDDVFLQRSLARALVAAGYEVSCHAQAESMLEPLTRQLQAGRLVCVLLDVQLGRLNGLDAQKLIRQIDADVPVVFISAQQDAVQVNQAWRDGASNFLFKPFTPQELLDALQQAMRRKTVAPSGDGTEATAEQKARVASLTPRQRQVFKLLAQGRTNLQIAVAIGISARTVKLHRSALMQRLQCRHMADLVRIHDACHFMLAQG